MRPRSTTAWLKTGLGVGFSVLWGLFPLSAEETLTAYFFHDGTEASTVFETETLPALRTFATEEGITLRTVNPLKGAPAEVTISPLVVFQNHRGRSIYQGRTTTPERLRTLVETARWVPQTGAPRVRSNVVARVFGRTTVASPVKVASVSGSLPPQYDEAAFQQEARAAIAKGLRASRFVPALKQGRADRAFYMDFYPWVSERGRLVLSYALFSQFHCKKPVYFSSEAEKLEGPWRRRHDLFAQAAERLEAEIFKQFARPDGDGFLPLPEGTPRVDWPPLPAAPAELKSANPGAFELGTTWELAPDPKGPPALLFQFPAPIDQYRGTIGRVEGALQFPDTLAVSSLTGTISADPNSVDMGESDLNDALSGKSFLDTAKFPEARFTIESVESDGVLAFGQLSTLVMSGTFELKGKRIPLTVPGDLEPVVRAGEPRLQLRGSWSLDFSGFDIEPADGPSPQRHTLDFELNTLFRPTASK